VFGLSDIFYLSTQLDHPMHHVSNGPGVETPACFGSKGALMAKMISDELCICGHKGSEHVFVLDQTGKLSLSKFDCTICDCSELRPFKYIYEETK
jgi:hypothetical protein